MHTFSSICVSSNYDATIGTLVYPWLQGRLKQIANNPTYGAKFLIYKVV